ncbi:MAG: hypothetical protein ACXWIQ_15995, partial [Caldimonas sp.]
MHGKRQCACRSDAAGEPAAPRGRRLPRLARCGPLCHTAVAFFYWAAISRQLTRLMLSKPGS